MIRVIYEIIRTNGENKTEIITNTKELIYYRLYLNPFLFNGFCGKRCDTIYCDSRFMDDLSGKEMIDSIFKPMLCFRHPDGEGFRIFDI